MGYYSIEQAEPMALFKKKLHSSDIGLILLKALMDIVESQRAADQEMLCEWFGELTPQHAKVYNELQYARAVAVDFAIRSCFEGSVAVAVLNEFRRHFEQTGNEMAAQRKEVLPFYHFYRDRLTQYETGLVRASGPRSTLAELGGLFTKQCGLEDDILIAARVTVEFFAIQKHIEGIVSRMRKDYSLVA